VARKFILIDQSIASIAGHHYEYAVHVLEAAQRAGFEPYLATHGDFAGSSFQSPWKTFPYFRYSFWAAQERTQSTVLEWLAGLAGKLRFRWRLFRNYSWPGLLWAVQSRFGEFLLKQPADRAHLERLPALIAGGIAMKLARLAVLLLLLPLALAVFLARGIGRLLLAGGFPLSYVRSLAADLSDLLWFQREVFKRRNQWRQWWRQYRSIKGFGATTRRLLAEIKPGAGDIVFLPTVSAIEVMGLATLLRTRPAGGGPSWHLLMRRDIYQGREVDYAAQEGRLNELRQVMMTAAAKLKGHHACFYTDTDELTAQYNRLGAFPFQTAPIPHTPAARPRREAAPLRIIYMGDARKEKGYHLIPRLVEDLWDDYLATGRVSFHLQSNYNVPNGEPEAVIAREQLEMLAGRAGGSVELIKEPMTSAQYRSFLLSGDINLLLYDPVNYYARSSGILVESLAAGVPVVVPAGTWLARQFQQAVYQRRRGLRDQMRIVQTTAGQQLDWRVHGSPETPALVNESVTATLEGKAFTRVAIPPGATHLLVCFRYGNGANEGFLYAAATDAAGNVIGRTHTHLLEADAEGGAAGWIAIQAGAAKLWLALGSTAATAAISVENFSIDFLAPRAGQQQPPSAVGGVYQHPGEIAALVREMVEHHAHYEQTARQFGGNWRQYHNAGALIGQLAAAAEAGPG